MPVSLLELTADHTRRVAQIRRAFQRQLKRRPTDLERLALRRAADLTAAAERACADPTVSLNDVVRLDHAAHRARLAFLSVAGIRLSKPRSSGRTNWLEAGR